MIVALFQWKIGHENLITACNFSPDGKYVVAGLDVDHGICLTDALNAKILIHIKGEFEKKKKKGEFAWAPCSVLSAMATAACHLTDF